MKKWLASVTCAVALCTALAAPVGAVASATIPSSPRPRANVPPPEAVGLYPTHVPFDKALRGGQYEDTIGVLNGTPHGQWFHFSLSGAAAPWLSVMSSPNTAPIKEIWAPGGAGATRAILQLRVPSTLANGAYHGVITVWMKPPKTKTNGPTTVGLGGEITVTVSVTGTEVVAGKLVDAYTYPKVEQGEPLKIFAIVNNSGNVAARPSFHLQILKAGARHPAYNWVGTTGEALLPGERSTYQLSWPANSTEGATLGKYTARILSVTFPGTKDVGSWALAFQLYPFGALHRGGKFLSLKLLNKPHAGYSAELQASVVSSGQVQQETTFVGQLYRNGNLLEGLKSPVPVLLSPAGQPGDTGTIQVAVPITKDGLYRVTGLVNFAGAQSATKTLTFRVGPRGLSRADEIAAGAGALLLAILLISLIVVRKRRQRRALPLRQNAHLPPRYTATHPRALRVPPKDPVGDARQRPVSRR